MRNLCAKEAKEKSKEEKIRINVRADISQKTYLPSLFSQVFLISACSHHIVNNPITYFVLF